MKPPPKRLTGKVKWFRVANGFGIIAADWTHRAYDVDFKDIEGPYPKTLHEGDRVEFLARNQRGSAKPRAVSVREILEVQTRD